MYEYKNHGMTWIFSRKPTEKELAAFHSTDYPGFFKQLFTKAIDTDLTVYCEKYPDIRSRYDAGRNWYWHY